MFRAFKGNLAASLQIVILTSVFSHFASAQTEAPKASMILYPTRAVLESGERVINVNLLNRGNASGAYRVQLVDSEMIPKGNVRLVEDGRVTAQSLLKFTRFSPRKTQLLPGDSQNIRILVRAPKNLPDGEYFGHLKVLMTSSNVESDEKQLEAEDRGEDKGFSLSIKQRSAVAVPIIYRHGKTWAKLEFTAPIIDKQAKTISFDMHRDGNQSVMGDIVADYIMPSGEVVNILNDRGKPVYANVDVRHYQSALGSDDVDIKTVNFSGGKIRLRYVDNENPKIIITEQVFPI